MGALVKVADAQVTALGAMDDGLVLPDGSAVVYLTGTTMYRQALPGGMPVKLAVGVSQLLNIEGTGYDLSPDGKWMVVPDSIDDETGTSELLLVSTQLARAPLELVGDVTGAIYGDAFTRDSSSAIYFSSVSDVGSGPLHARPTSGGIGVDLGASAAWYVYAASGRKVVWNDNYVADPKEEGPGTADIFVADTSADTPGTLMAARADEDFVLSRAGDKVAFTSRVAGREGLYVLPVP